MKRPIRFAFWAWGAALDDLETFCLPSLAQPNNIPWLLRNGHPVSLDFYARREDNVRIQALAETFHRELQEMESGENATASLGTVPDDLNEIDLKCLLFRSAWQNTQRSDAQGIFGFADRYFGDGSIRNIVTYAQKPHVTVGGLHLPVERERFRAQLVAHRTALGAQPVSNARLTDMCLESLTPGMRASFVDVDANASFATGASFLPLADDLCSFTSHLVKPMLFDINEQDIGFFERFQSNYALFNHVWPSMLVAQNRWRVMASSDLFCVADIGAGQAGESVALRSGMQHNDEYRQEHLHGRMQQTTLMALRRERLPA